MTNLRSARIDHHFERFANGKVWLWETGIDFHETTESFIGRAKRYARINRIPVKIRIVPGGVRVQFGIPERTEGGEA